MERTQTADAMIELFGEPIAIFTRAQAIDDEVLIDVSVEARAYGFRWPLAVSASVYGDLNRIPVQRAGWETFTGRLRDLLGVTAMRMRCAPDGVDRLECVFLLTLPENVERFLSEEDDCEMIEYPYSVLVGPGDEGEPVITICRPWEE